MATDITWSTKVINVYQADLTPVTGTLYELDTDVFRRELLSIEDSEQGMAHWRTHKHNTEVTVAGTTFARTLEIINGYSITFEDGAYSVRLVGSNNNFFDIQNDILNQNQVQVIPTNSAGLIVGEGGTGTAPTAGEVADAVWDEPTAAHVASGTFGRLMKTIKTYLQ